MTRFHKSGDAVECSFCSKAQSRVGKLIAGPGGVYICDECIDLCNLIIEEEGFDPRRRRAPTSSAPAGGGAMLATGRQLA